MADNPNDAVVNFTPINTIYSWFETGDFPTEAQFKATYSSYWHKSESIPMGKINGLNDAFNKTVSISTYNTHLNDPNAHSELAKRDASNLTDDNIESWKEALEIGELPDNIATYDYDIQDHVMMKDGTILPAGDLGKNIANSHLQTTEQGGLTQNYNFAWTYGENALQIGYSLNSNDPEYSLLRMTKQSIACSVTKSNLGYSSGFLVGQSQIDLSVNQTRIKLTNGSIAFQNASNLEINALNEKSTDSTYNKLLGINTAGNVAKVDGKTAFKGFLSALNPTEALEIAQILNGGSGSVGAMSVNLISPPIIQNRFNTVEYILLRGANLNLNATSSSIQILASDKTTVIVTIPNNQIQINANGTELVFFYNFHNFVEGTYFIKLISGVKTYITTIDLTIVQQIENINTSAITWDINPVIDAGTTHRTSTANGASFSITNPTGSNSISSFLGVKSSELFAEGDDFYLEIELNISQIQNVGGSGATNLSYLGLGYSSSLNNNIINSIINISYRSNGVDSIYFLNNNIPTRAETFSGVAVTLIFIKTGNLFRTIFDGVQTSKTLSNNSGYSLFFNFCREPNYRVIQGIVSKAFKLN